MFKFLRSLFSKSKEQPSEKTNEAYRDFVDYDGMGNQGRFPTKETNR